MLASIVYGDRVTVLKSMCAAHQTPKEMNLFGKEDSWNSSYDCALHLSEQSHIL